MINLTARIGGSKLRSIGFIMMKTCWFLCVSPDSSLRAALQKYWTQPCFPKKVEGRPKGRPNLKGKLWMPPDNSTGSPPGTKKKIKHIIKINLFKIFFWPIVICTKVDIYVILNKKFVKGIINSFMLDLFQKKKYFV